MTPVIGEVAGAKIRIYARDHIPPHVHATKGDESASYDIATGEKLAGGIPGNTEKRILDWIRENREDLSEMWETKSFRKLPPTT